MTFAQHNFSLQHPGPQDQIENIKVALDAVERMKNLGFDVKWIQELIGRAAPKDQESPLASAVKTQPQTPGANEGEG